MSIEQAALKLNQIAQLAFSKPMQALDELGLMQIPPGLSFLHYAVVSHIRLESRPARKPRSSNKLKAKL